MSITYRMKLVAKIRTPQCDDLHLRVRLMFQSPIDPDFYVTWNKVAQSQVQDWHVGELFDLVNPEKVKDGPK